MAVVGTAECLDDETLAAFANGRLASSELPRVEAHLATCDDCNLVVAAAASGPLDSKAPDMAPRELVEADLLAVGDVVAGKYRIEGMLGRGGMGVVYSARHVRLGHRVAIKALDSNEPKAATRFLREARTCAQLLNDHIARVFDLGHLPNGVPFFSMEHLSGEDLARALARGPVGPTLAVEYVLQACTALAAAHAAGVIHRDLKPSNIFIARRPDGSPLVKVLDFGLSKFVSAHGLGITSSVTLTQSLVGSPQYMSPEQILSSETLDARTDIWSIGVILYELATRQRPFPGSTLPAILISIATQQPRAPSSLAQDVSPGLEHVILRCLEKNPAARYPDIAALVEALRQLQLRSGNAAGKSTPGPSLLVVKQGRPGLSQKAALSAGLCLASALLVWIWYRPAARSSVVIDSSAALSPRPGSARVESLLAMPALAVEPASTPPAPVGINPFLEAELYVDPEYRVGVAWSMTSHPEDAALLQRVKGMSTAYWINSVEQLSSVDALLGAVEKQARELSKPVLPVFVVYNLPQRDCYGSYASAELVGTTSDEQRYRTQFIDPIASIFAAHPTQRAVVLLEPNAVASLVTHGNTPKCARARAIQENALSYAIARLSLPNVFLYMDAGHANWLGWDDARSGVATLVERLLHAAGGLDRIRGFVTNVGNYTPLEGEDVTRLDPDNPCPNELRFVEKLSADLEAKGIPGKRFIVDTSRNGRSGVRPKAGAYCNLIGAGLGERPRAAPRPLIDAYYWVKSPGASDGTDDRAAPRYDPVCASPGAAPRSPDAGWWFDAYFVELVKNANPPL